MNMKSKKILLVVAPTHRVFVNYCEDNGISPNPHRKEALYIDDKQRLIGFTEDQVAVVYIDQTPNSRKAENRLIDLWQWIFARGYPFLNDDMRESMRIEVTTLIEARQWEKGKSWRARNDGD